MKKQIDQRTCDHCGKVVNQDGPMYGGSMFGGWVTIEIENGSTRMPRPDNGPWDCCSRSCALFLLDEKTK